MTREQFMDLDDWALVNVFCRPSTKEDGYWPVPRFNPFDPPVAPVSLDEQFVAIWRMRGLKDAEILERYKKWKGDEYDGKVPGGIRPDTAGGAE